jgi:hypothetical protein
VQLKDIIPIISALIAAFIGSFLGAFFKESASDFYYKRKRKREVLGLLARDINLLFSLIIKHAGTRSAYKMYSLRQKIALREMDKSGSSDSKEFKNWQGEYNLDVEQMMLLHKEEAEILTEMNRLYSGILALGFESSIYFERHIGNAIMKLVTDLEAESDRPKMTIRENLTFNEIVDFHVHKYASKLTELSVQIRERRTGYLQRLKEIVSS